MQILKIKTFGAKNLAHENVISKQKKSFPIEAIVDVILKNLQNGKRFSAFRTVERLRLLRLLLALQLLQPGYVGGVAEVDLVSGLLAALPDSSPVVAFVVAVAAVAGVVAFGSVKELPLLAGVEQVVLFPGLLAPLLHLLDFALGSGKH